MKLINEKTKYVIEFEYQEVRDLAGIMNDFLIHCPNGHYAPIAREFCDKFFNLINNTSFKKLEEKK